MPTQKPTYLTQVRSFLGLCNVSHQILTNCAYVAAPINKRTRKNQPQTFEGITEDEMEALKTLKPELMEHPRLGLNRSQGIYNVDTDAYDREMRCVLLQKFPNGTERRIGYWSRLLNDMERAYDFTNEEWFTVVWTVLLIWPYVEGCLFTNWTDQDAIKWILNWKNLTGRLAWWRQCFSKFKFDVLHPPD